MSGIQEPREAATIATTRAFTKNLRRALGSMLSRRDDKDCHPQPGVNLCEKPGMSSSTVTWIIVGVVLGVLLIATLTVLLILHFRRRKRDRREDMEDRFHSADYGLDEIPAGRKPRPDDDGIQSHDGSPHPYGRRSREPLQAGAEPRYHPGQLNGHLNPFDDASSFRSGNGSSHPPSVNQGWPKRDTSQPKAHKEENP